MSAFFIRLWRFRLVRLLMWLVLSLIVLYVLLFAYLNWSGSRHWAQVQATIESEGGTLDFAKLLPPRVDKATNFCAIPELDGIAAEGDDDSPQGRKRQALEHLGWETGTDSPPSISDGRALAQKIDLAAWAQFARETSFIKMPADSGNAARDLLQAIDNSQPLVKELADAAASHPNAAFTPLYKDRSLKSPLIRIPVFYYAAVVNAQRALLLRALAASDSGESATAAASTQAMLRLVDAFAQEPLVVGLLVSLRGHDWAEEAIWSILEKRHATEGELAALQAALERLQLDRLALAAMRGELAAAIDTVAFAYQKEKSGTDEMRLLSESEDEPRPRWLVRLFGNLIPNGLVDENKAVFASLDSENFIKPFRESGYSGTLRYHAAVEKELKAHQGILHPCYVLAERVAPAMLRIPERAAASDAIRRQAIIACALERFYLEHKVYPVALAGLVPQFLSAIPDDPMDGKPMRYAQASDGRYRIWSVGFDQKDDTGRVNPGRFDGKLWAYDLRLPQYQGDWTWQYQPVK